MRTIGLSVPSVVREIITRNRSIHDCMAMDVINYTALAVKIQPEVEKQIGNPVQLNTIVVAIKRYADAFEKNEEVVDEPVLKDARLSMTDRIMGMQWTMKDLLDQDMAKMFAEAEKAFSNSEVFRLGDSFRILADDSDVTRRIFQNFPKNPGLSVSAAKYLASKKIGLVGIDSPSIDLGTDSKFSVHQIFAKKGMLIVENLANLDKIKSSKFHLVVLPLKLKNATGSPVRAIAFVE